MAGRQIGDVAGLLGVPVETIRYYERCGLLDKPTRTGSNYRVYSDEQVERLGFILNCRNLDMTHEEIRRLLKLRHRPPKDCTEVNALIDEHIAHIDERISELRRLSKQLHALRTSCNEIRSVDACEILSTLRRPPSVKATKASPSHVGTHVEPKIGKRGPRRRTAES
jgi:Cd(II)/Pb(II)-responsive transcriptional regulator